MIRHKIVLVGYKYGIIVAMAVFVIACFLGFSSNLPIETIVKKSIIAGFAMGLCFFVAVRILSNFVPDDLGIEDKRGDSNTSKADEETQK